MDTAVRSVSLARSSLIGVTSEVARAGGRANVLAPAGRGAATAAAAAAAAVSDVPDIGPAPGPGIGVGIDSAGDAVGWVVAAGV